MKNSFMFRDTGRITDKSSLCRDIMLRNWYPLYGINAIALLDRNAIVSFFIDS